MSNKKLDLLSTKTLVELFLEEEQKAITSLQKQKSNITKAVNIIIKKYQKGGKIIYIGAGTSGRLGILDAVECKPTFSTNSFYGIIAGGQGAFFKAIEGLEDNTKNAIKDLKKIKLTKDDVVVGISASGETPYTISAVMFAKKLKALTISITSNPKSTLSKIVTCSISTPVGEEIISGSSRLKSGTLQKVILNMLSSISMIKSGKVYENLMIDVKPTNKKLVKRAIRIISIICKVPLNKAKLLFKRAKKNVKAAIVMHFKNCSHEKAISILKNADFNLRKVIS